ncbi:hypothetical protein [Fervidicola ferrireducens]
MDRLCKREKRSIFIYCRRYKLNLPGKLLI